MSLDNNIKLKGDKYRPNHTLIIGQAGTGKTLHLEQNIKKDILKNNNYIIVFETNGEIFNDLKKDISLKDKNIINLNLYDSNFNINLLDGAEDDVVREFLDTYRNFHKDSLNYFLDINTLLLKNSIKVIKRTYGKEASLLKLEELIDNEDNKAITIIDLYLKNNKEKEDLELANWFYNEYFNYEHTNHYNEGKFFIRNINKNKYLSNILTLSEDKEYLNLEKTINSGSHLFINIGLKSLKKEYLQFKNLLWEKIRTIILNRDIKKDTKKISLYIDEANLYFNSDLALDIITKRLEYQKVNLVLAMQSVLSVNKELQELLKLCFKNIIIMIPISVKELKYLDDFIEDTEE